MTNEPTDTSPPDLCAACERLRVAMQAAGLLERPAPPAAVRWIATFGAAYPELLERPEAALETVRALRAEAVTLRALDLERLRSRAVLFFLDAFGQWVDDQPELCGLD
ncbi:MAG: hypothetical protein ACREQ5_19410, partial [Candidatus Dormibacteria bacterium]